MVLLKQKGVRASGAAVLTLVVGQIIFTTFGKLGSKTGIK